jgi:hypothetical protein
MAVGSPILLTSSVSIAAFRKNFIDLAIDFFHRPPNPFLE